MPGRLYQSHQNAPVTPCDLPIHEENNDSLPSDKISQSGGPIYDETVRHQIDSPHVIEQRPQNGVVVDIEVPVEGVAYGGTDDTDVQLQVPGQISDDDSTTNQSPVIDRPRRQRRPNVRYSELEYDLSSVAAPKKRFQLSGLYIVNKSPDI